MPHWFAAITVWPWTFLVPFLCCNKNKCALQKNGLVLKITKFKAWHEFDHKDNTKVIKEKLLPFTKYDWFVLYKKWHLTCKASKNETASNVQLSRKLCITLLLFQSQSQRIQSNFSCDIPLKFLHHSSPAWSFFLHHLFLKISHPDRDNACDPSFDDLKKSRGIAEAEKGRAKGVIKEWPSKREESQEIH